MRPTDSNQDPATRTTASAFDEHGRRVPPAGLRAAAHRGSRRRFVPAQPTIDLAAVHARLATHLGAEGAPDTAEFASRVERLTSMLATDPATRSLLAGVHVPFFLPRAAHEDLGSALAERYVPAVGRSFEATSKPHRFQNHFKGSLKGVLSVAPGSRHERLVEAMRDGAVVGLYFPCLLEYSVPAAIEQMASLPSSLLLAGGYDTCAAFAGSPSLLLRTDGYPPLLWLAGLRAEREDVGYHFEAYGYDLTFNRRVHLGQAAEYWASALVAIDG